MSIWIIFQIIFILSLTGKNTGMIKKLENPRLQAKLNKIKDDWLKEKFQHIVE
jgi:hypothetical protein